MPVWIAKRERKLLFYAMLYIASGISLLYLAPVSAESNNLLIYGGIILAAFIVTHFLLGKWVNARDPYLFPITALISGTGLVFLFRLRPELAEKQFYWILIGLLVLLLTVRFFKDYRKLADYTYVYIIIGVIMLLMTIFLGITVGGARSWIAIGNFRFQPSEMVKIFLVVFLASYLDEEKAILATGTQKIGGLNFPPIRHFGPLLVMWGLSLGLLVVQKDLGAALLFFGTFLVMLYIATARISYMVVGTGLFAIAASIGYLVFQHVEARVNIWLNPWPKAQETGYQIVQSLMAIGSGGYFGSGLGLGFPKLIPAVHTDFIFSAITEEMGLFGGIGMILVYILFLYRGFKIALEAEDDFGALLAAGLTSLFAIQTFVILAGVTKLLPLTGITLPFISYGGSSLVANYVLLGLLLNISHKDREFYEK